MREAIVVIGGAAQDSGDLGASSLDCLHKGIELLRKQSDCRMVLTSRFRMHFNLGLQPNVDFARECRVQQWPASESFLDSAEGRETLQDALMSKEYVVKWGCRKIVIVAPEERLATVRYIFSQVFRGYELGFEGVRPVASPVKSGDKMEYSPQLI